MMFVKGALEKGDEESWVRRLGQFRAACLQQLSGKRRKTPQQRNRGTRPAGSRRFDPDFPPTTLRYRSTCIPPPRQTAAETGTRDYAPASGAPLITPRHRHLPLNRRLPIPNRRRCNSNRRPTTCKRRERRAAGDRAWLPRDSPGSLSDGVHHQRLRRA